MVYLLKGNQDLKLSEIGDAVLGDIERFKYRGETFFIERSRPVLISGNPAYGMYALGTFSYGLSFDRVFAFKLASPGKVLSPDITEKLQEIGFEPNLAVLLGIESANGFDNTPWHKNLSRRRFREALQIGKSIRECTGVEDRVIFIHSSVDNREVIRMACVIE